MYLFGFIIRKFAMMHGHMNVKKMMMMMIVMMKNQPAATHKLLIINR
jgi:hypothetical protein